MFGSMGWGLAMFIMGMVLDHSKIFQVCLTSTFQFREIDIINSISIKDARCDMNEGQRNYNVCFSVFSTLMGLALIVATQMPFKYSSNAPKDPGTMPMNNMNGNGSQVI